MTGYNELFGGGGGGGGGSDKATSSASSSTSGNQFGGISGSEGGGISPLYLVIGAGVFVLGLVALVFALKKS